MKAKNLAYENFDGPLITHGIEIVDGEEPDTVYVFAINHLPNPDHYSPSAGSAPAPHKARSQIELFRHKLGSDTVRHVRSIRHDLIETPNDIYATSPTSFYVTNDHKNRGGIMRLIEEVLTQYLAGWSTTIHVDIDDLDSKSPDLGLHASVALRGLHNNNGLGHSSPQRPNEVVIGDASGGIISFAERSLVANASPELIVVEQVHFDTCVDNPSYYDDLYATSTDTASGYVVAGLAEAHKVSADAPFLDRPLSVVVWHVRPEKTEALPQGGQSRLTWEKRLIFSDDGHTVRSAATAVMVPIDPAETDGKKQAWLFVTGFASAAIVASKIDL